jgi:hypothetical protein
VRTDDRQHRQRKRDVGGGRDGPAAQRVASCAGGDQEVEHRGRSHAPDCRGDGQRRPARVPQVTGDELALELQADDEEEDRQQAVRRPGGQREVQMERRRTDPQVAQ